MARIDIALTKREDDIYDVTFTKTGDFEASEGLDTAILLSLLEERRANSAEVSTPQNRRGWIGNELGDIATYELGSKLWLLDQERLTTDTLNRAVDYARQALQWLLDNDIAQSVTINGEIQFPDGIRLFITLTRDNNNIESFFFNLWDNTLFREAV